MPSSLTEMNLSIAINVRFDFPFKWIDVIVTDPNKHPANNIVGKLNAEWRSSDVLFITDFVVSFNERDKGIGSNMLKALENYVVENNHTIHKEDDSVYNVFSIEGELSPHVDDAIRLVKFYQSLGYTIDLTNPEIPVIKKSLL